MSEVTKEEFDVRQNQFKAQLRSVLTDGGVAVGGVVQRKNHWPAKEDKDASWSVEVAYVGGASYISVSEALYNRCGVGSYQLFRVIQRGGKEGKIYSTAIEY